MNRRGTFVVLTLVSALGAFFSAPAVRAVASQQPNATDTLQQIDEWHAPDLYDARDEGVTAPVLVRETKPNYNSEAMRSSIQGWVRLDCIVEIDGKIRMVRIRHSVDPRGLDAEAVRTVREWLFKPGLKDGVAVRTLVAIEISYALGRYEIPRLEWPEDVRPKDANGKTPDRFRKETFTAENLQITLRYPPDWKVLKDGQNDRLITIEQTAERDASSCTLSKLQPAKTDLMAPMTNTALKDYAAGRLKEQFGSDANIKLLKVGQIGTVDRVWVWSEMSRRHPDVSRLPPDGASSVAAQFEGIRTWLFTTTDSWQELSVICDVFIPHGATKDTIKQSVRGAGADFAEIVRGISIRPQ